MMYTEVKIVSKSFMKIINLKKKKNEIINKRAAEII